MTRLDRRFRKVCLIKSTFYQGEKFQKNQKAKQWHTARKPI
jgi:hypothetical protein